MQKAGAVTEYVEVCRSSGAGFFRIPGTSTCLRLGGRVSARYTFNAARTLAIDKTNFMTQGRLEVDARTPSEWGTLRTFVRFDIASGTGKPRGMTGFSATGIDTAGRAGKYVEVDKAFIQFAGLTAGRASSFFDFYAHDAELIGSTVGSDVSSTNLLAYTKTL